MDSKGENLNMILDHWISTEFLSQPSMDEKEILKATKGSVSGKMSSKPELVKEKVSELDAKLFHECMEYIKSKEEEYKRNNYYISKGWRILISFGHLNRNIFTKYMAARYGWTEMPDINFGDNEFIACGAVQFEKMYKPRRRRLEIRTFPELSTLCLVEDYLRHGKTENLMQVSRFFYTRKSNEFWIRTTEVKIDKYFCSDSYETIEKYCKFFREWMNGLVKEMEEYISEEEMEEFKKEAYSVYYRAERINIAKDMTIPTGCGLYSFYIDDLEMIRNSFYSDITVNGKNELSYENKFMDFILHEKKADGRIDISSQKAYENLRKLFMEHLDPKKAPSGKWPGGHDPGLMQQLAINLSRNEALPVFSVNGPPGTGKSTLLTEVIADVLTRKVFRMTEILEENDYDPDRLFLLENLPKYRDIFKYGILIASDTNAAVENITAESPENGESLPLMATLGRVENIKKYSKENIIIEFGETEYLIKSGSQKEEHIREKLKKATLEFKECYENVEKMRSLLHEEWINGEADKFWEKYTSEDEKDREEVQLYNSCNNERFSELRENLFEKAWEVHQLFAFSSNYLIDRIPGALESLEKNWGPDTDIPEELFYNMLFFISPVISSTFASIRRLFGQLEKPQSMGLLIVDESGQVSPQHAAGALFRASKALIVGDPKQIPPVVTQQEKQAMSVLCPEGLRHELTDLGGFEEGDPQENIHSLQVYADNINPYGTVLGGVWVGCPLTVHRRCISPMFEISNKLSYEETMVNKVIQPKDNSMFILPHSYWIQIKGYEGGLEKNRFVKRQAEAVLKMVLEKCMLYAEVVEKEKQKKEKKRKKDKVDTTDETGAAKMSEPEIPEMSLFVITPFVSVAEGFKNYIKYFLQKKKYEYIRKRGIYKTAFQILSKWKNEKNIGTVHTFQGRQAEEVIFLLGCGLKRNEKNLEDEEPRCIRGAMWISRNIVNVAVSRAKFRLYIVGDMDIWRKKDKRTEHPLNSARLIMSSYYNEYDCGDKHPYRLGIEDLNDKLHRTHEFALGTGKEKEEYLCPKCGGAVTKGSNGWFCRQGCGMLFNVYSHMTSGVYPLDTGSIRKLMKNKTVLFNSFNETNEIFRIEPEIEFDYVAKTKDKNNNSVETEIYRYKNVAVENIRMVKKHKVPTRESLEESEKKNIAPFLLCNCSDLIQGLRSNRNPDYITFDYFNIMILDAIYTLRTEGIDVFTSLDILRLLSGNPNPDPGSGIRTEIEKRINLMMKNGLYRTRGVKAGKNDILLPNLEALERRKYRFKKDVEAPYYVRFVDGKLPKGKRKAILEIPVEYLNPIEMKNDKEKKVFPMTLKWLQLRYYILYRIAYMYKIKKTSRIIKFSTMEEVLDLTGMDGKESNKSYLWTEKKRLHDNIVKFMEYLKKKSYISEYKINDSIDDEGYCGIASLEINPGIWEIPEETKRKWLE